MPRQINVCYLITGLNVGGAEKVLARTVALLDRDRYHPIVCSLIQRGLVAAEMEKTGVQVISLGATTKLDLWVIPKLFRLLKQRRIDIIHSHMFHANMLGRLVGRLAKIPIIISSEHGMGTEGWPRLLLNRLTAPLVDKIIAVCEPVRNFAIKEIGISPDRLVTIYNGVDLSQYSGEPNPGRTEEVKRELGITLSHKVVGTVGHLEPEKGCEYLLQAAARVSAQDGNVTFLFVGDGSQRTRLENLAKDLSVSSNVIFMGYRNDVPKILSVTDVFVLPSLYEGLPYALLEAMAACRPVVATQVGGVPEAVVEGETGFLVPPRSSEALAEAIGVLLRDKERAAQMGLAGRRWVEGLFSDATMVAKTEELYEGLIREKALQLGRRPWKA